MIVFGNLSSALFSQFSQVCIVGRGLSVEISKNEEENRYVNEYIKMYKYKCIHEYTLYDNIDVKCTYRHKIFI